jgi:hypothetical protein
VLGGQKQEGFRPYEARPLSVEAIKAREELVAKRVAEEERRLGVGVSLDGQRIYEAFAKTYRYSPRVPPFLCPRSLLAGWRACGKVVNGGCVLGCR